MLKAVRELNDTLKSQTTQVQDSEEVQDFEEASDPSINSIEKDLEEDNEEEAFACFIAEHNIDEMLELLDNRCKKMPTRLEDTEISCSSSSETSEAADLNNGLPEDKLLDLVKLLLRRDEPEDEEHLIDAFLKDLNLPPTISLTRCAAHRISLACDTDMKDDDAKNLLTVKAFVKILRTPSAAPFLRENKLGKPPLDVVTRWLSRFKMCDFIAKNKNVLQQYVAKKDVKTMRAKDWLFVSEYTNAFRPINQLLMYAQKKEFCHADFYIRYITTSKKLKNGSELSQKLQKIVEKRLERTFNEITFACLYCTPYGNTYLKTQNMEKEIVMAQKKLMEIAALLQAIDDDNENNFSHTELSQPLEEQQCQVEKSLNESDGSTTSESEADLKAMMLANEAVKSNEQIVDKLADVRKYLLSLTFLPQHLKEAKESNVSWWVQKGSKIHSKIWPIVQVLLAAPITEVDSERSFSALRLLVSDLRSRISAKLIDSILIIKQNLDLFNSPELILDYIHQL